MNWEAIGAIGEIMGAIAVVATLAYLALQTKHLRKATLADVYQSRALARGNSQAQIALNSPSFHKTLFKFESALETKDIEEALRDLTEEEKFLLGAYHHAIVMRSDNVHFQYNQGFLPDTLFETMKRDVGPLVPIWKALGLEGTFPILSQELFESLARKHSDGDS